MNPVQNPLRQSYEARVLVVPLEDLATPMVLSLGGEGVEGVRALTGPDDHEAVTEALGSQAWQPPAPASTAELARSADIVVLVGTDLATISEALVREVCGAARTDGDLVAAVLVAPQHWEEPAGATAMVTLRQEVDMLISVRSTTLVAALLDVLRGGPRDPELAALAGAAE